MPHPRHIGSLTESSALSPATLAYRPPQPIHHGPIPVPPPVHKSVDCVHKIVPDDYGPYVNLSVFSQGLFLKKKNANPGLSVLGNLPVSAYAIFRISRKGNFFLFRILNF